MSRRATKRRQPPPARGMPLGILSRHSDDLYDLTVWRRTPQGPRLITIIVGSLPYVQIVLDRLPLLATPEGRAEIGRLLHSGPWGRVSTEVLRERIRAAIAALDQLPERPVLS